MRKQIFTMSVLASMTFASLTNAQDAAAIKTDEFKPSGKVTGQFFGDYFMKMHADSAARGSSQYSGKANPKNYNTFAIRRIYLGYDYQMSEQFSTQVLFANENDNADASGQRTVYIKAANIKWKNFIKNNDLILGQTATPFFALSSDGIWGYRSVEKSVADMRGFCGSNDLGIMVQGKLNDKGDYGYNFMVGNGTGQKPETNKYKKGYGEVFAKFLDQKLIIDLAGTYEQNSIAAKKATSTSKLTIAYQTKQVTVGAEAVMQTQTNAATDTTNGKKNANQVNVTPFAFSVFVRGQIIENKLQYFARYDSYNPNTTFDANSKYSTAMNTNKEGFATVGLDWTPVKNAHIMPNIWYDGFTSMKNNQKSLAKSDYDLTARLTVFYKF